MKMKIKIIDMNISQAIIHADDWKKLKLLRKPLLELKDEDENTFYFSAIKTKENSLIGPGTIAVSLEKPEKGEFPFKENQEVEVNHYINELGKTIISKAIDKKILEKEEVYTLVKQINNNQLTDLQIAAYTLSQNFKGMEFNIEEITYLAQAIADSGNKLDFPGAVYDKHSIGGVPGNKISLLIVPIIAAAGLTIPKTSTRAITSASGTVNTMQALGCETDFTVDEVYEMVNKNKGCIISGEKLDIAPVNNKIIRKSSFPLGIDPKGMMLAGILANKIAMDIDFLVLDIPVGPGVKMKTEADGRNYGRKFIDLASKLNITAEAGITYGGVPVGHNIGPALEAREGLAALINPRIGSRSLVEKATSLAGILLEMASLAARGSGKIKAWEILDSGKAYEKMKGIIEAQGGNPNIKPEDIPLEEHIIEFKSPQDGWPIEIKNKILTMIARTAGAPTNPGAGVELKTKKDSVRAGETIFTVYAHSEAALDKIRGIIAKEKPVTIEGLLIERIM